MTGWWNPLRDGDRGTALCPGSTLMDTRQLRENRAAFPAAELAKYRGQWVAFSMDGRRIVASAADFVELDARVLALGEDPQRLPLEYTQPHPIFLPAPHPP